MNVMVIYAHPYDGSYNHALLESTIKGLKEGNHNIDVVDLNKEDFNPIMTAQDLYSVAVKHQPIDPKVLEYQKRIEQADHLVFIFPIWFESVPAILKGFLDKVFSNGWAYKNVEGKSIPVGQLTHLNATVISTMGVSKYIYGLYLNNAVQGVLIKGTLKFSGVKKVKWFKMDRIQKVTDEQRKDWLKETENYMRQL